MEENPERYNVMKLWKVYIIEYTIVIEKKNMKAITLETNSCLGGKKNIYIYIDVVHDFTGLMTESIKENMRL